MSDLLQSMFDMEEDTQKDRYLTFLIEEECYGIEIKYVTEIIGMQAITQVPEQPNFIRGIINLRGKIIPVMDVRVRFKKEMKEYTERTCIIVVDINDLAIGLIVDRVSEVLTIPSENIAEPPIVYNGGNRYLKNIGKVGTEVKLLLDCEKMLTETMYDEIESMEYNVN